MCSGGDKTVKGTEESAAAFQKTLTGIFSAQFGKQSKITDFLTSKLEPMVANPQGYSPEALAAMRSGATDATANQYTDALKASRAQRIAAGGGMELPSGVDAQIEGQLAGAAAGAQASGQRDITLANENQRQSNMWSAFQALNGTAQTLNPQSYAGEATGAGNSVAGLSQAFKSSQSSQLLGALGGLAGGAGSALGSYFTGGLSNLAKAH